MAKPSKTNIDLLIEALDRALDALGFDDEHQVRIIRRDDGREVMIVQANAFSVSRLYVSGRPDGKRIGEHASYFDMIDERIRRHRTEHGSDLGVHIEPEEWEALFAEARDRYVRYLFFSGIQRWADVERDTLQNLTVCNWARKYADEELAWRVYQFKGYILMMNSIARAEMALASGNIEEAEKRLAIGVESIGAYCRECLLSGREDAEQITREHYLANMLKYREDLILDGRLPDAGREDPRNVV